MSETGKPNGKRHTRFHGRVEDTGRGCDWADCGAAGEFRAPPAELRAGMSRYDGPGEYRWYCLDHIRAFNQGYNFFAGMNSDEIYEAQRPVSGWDRETRAFASGVSNGPKWADFEDPLDAIGARFKDGLRRHSQAGSAGAHLNKADRKALKTLGLGYEADRRAIRSAYSRLVRAYHPDRNGGDRSHEKALQEVIGAYTHLKKASAFAT